MTSKPELALADKTPFPFFLGRGRSGTTLVRAIFDSHSQMAVPNESYFVAAMSANRHRYETPSGFQLETFMQDLFRRRGFISWGLDLEAVREELLENRPGSLADAIRAVYRVYAREHGKTRYGDKTPIYVMAIDPVAAILPEAVFVHVVRDGRDSALSYREVPWGPATIEESAFRWRRAVGKARSSARTLDPSRYTELRYEDLVADPEKVVRAICHFIGLGYEEEMLKYFERADEVTALMRHPQTRSGIYKPVSSGLRDWSTQMPPSDVVRFEAIAARSLVEYGYPLSSHRVGLLRRLLSWIRVGQVLVSERIRKLRRRHQLAQEQSPG